MTEYAPAAITAMFNTIKAAIPSAQMGGIIGDAAHTYGYHRGRNYVSGSDYSVCQNPADRKGDGEAACALDLSWSNAADQYTVSRRLLDAKHDPALGTYLRSFFGSTDGYTVCGWDYYYGCPSTSDDSHLWHVHLSVTRQYANDHAALQQVAAVVTGGAAPQPEEEDMPSQNKLWMTSRPIAMKAGKWYTIGWDGWNPDGLSGGYSVLLHGKYYVATLAVGFDTLGADDNAYTRFQMVDSDTLAQTGATPYSEQRGTSGSTSLVDTQCGYVKNKENLRALVSATADCTLTDATLTVLAW